MSSPQELDLVRATLRGLVGEGGSVLRSLGDLGLLGLLVEESHGGAGWLPIEASVVAEEIGRAVAADGAEAPGASGSAPPWLGATVAVAALADADRREDLLASTLDGNASTTAVAGRLEVADGRASGSLAAVDLSEGTSAVVVVGFDGDNHLVELDDPGVRVRPDPVAIDTTRRLSRIDLDRAAVDPLGRSVAIRDAARVLSAATNLGSLKAALGRLVPYLCERIAFGSPIASFQSIQHRLVDLALLEIRIGVAVDAAARALVVDPLGSSRLAATAHALAAEHTTPALDECIQLTGGIGFTWEYPLHHELRRSVADGTSFGSARDSRETLLAVTGWM